MRAGAKIARRLENHIRNSNGPITGCSEKCSCIEPYRSTKTSPTRLRTYGGETVSAGSLASRRLLITDIDRAARQPSEEFFKFTLERFAFHGRRLVLPPRIGNWSLTSLQQRLVKTGGRLVKHARYYWLLLAESHLTRRLFASMLGRIDGLPLPSG